MCTILILLILAWKKLLNKAKIKDKCFKDGSVVKNLPANAGTWVQSLIQEDPTCHRATKPVHHNY